MVVVVAAFVVAKGLFAGFATSSRAFSTAFTLKVYYNRRCGVSRVVCVVESVESFVWWSQ